MNATPEQRPKGAESRPRRLSLGASRRRSAKVAHPDAAPIAGVRGRLIFITGGSFHDIRHAELTTIFTTGHSDAFLRF